MKKALYILKRDFRLRDNRALTAAIEENDAIMAIFILEPSFLMAPETSIFHLNAIQSAYTDLQKELEERGGSIHWIEGEYGEALEKIQTDFDFDSIYAHEEIGVLRTFRRDLALHAWCKSRNIQFKEFQQTGVFRPLKDRDKRHELWTKFTFDSLVEIPSNVDKLVAVPNFVRKDFRSEVELKMAYPNLFENIDPNFQIQEVSEKCAWKVLKSFTSGRAMGYSKRISSPNTALKHGSRLSAHLAWGTITGRTIYREVNQAIEKHKKEKEEGNPDAGKMASSLRSFLSRMHWRDHFMQRLESAPDMEIKALNPAYNDLEYENEPELLDKFVAGLTGFPMVDACIRCLRTTGFINFRMRAMLTSFACHTLHIDWRILHIPLANWFLDYEPGIHFSQIQMQAGVVGINTLRTYNPTKQLADHDPEVVFVKKWIPELRSFKAEEILNHGTEQLGNYPAHIVDWKANSAIMRKRVYDVRKTPLYKDVVGDVFDKHGSRKRTTKRKKKTSKSTTQLTLNFD